MNHSADIRYTKSGNVSLAYQTFGAGDTDLVLAPGYISNLEAERHADEPERIPEEIGINRAVEPDPSPGEAGVDREAVGANRERGRRD
jgi:hypothetical protein